MSRKRAPFHAGTLPQPPAAPEIDFRLTDAERTLLGEAFGGSSPSALLTSRVEGIVAERVRVVEGERDAAHEAGYWVGYGEGKEEAETRDLNYDEATDRAESAEAAHRALQAAVEALADEWASKPDDRRYDGDRARALRALLAGAR